MLTTNRGKIAKVAIVIRKRPYFFDNVADEMEAQQKWGLQFPLTNKLEQERKLAEGDLS